MANFSLKVNGEQRTVDVDPDTPLLWVLRDSIGLVGTKYGCGIGQCGACTVHVNGTALKSCSMTIDAADGKDITTIEGLDPNGQHPLQKSWRENDVPQCGYCQAGQIMKAAALLKENPSPSEAEVEASMSSNICRCGTYVRIKKAILDAAK